MRITNAVTCKGKGGMVLPGPERCPMSDFNVYRPAALPAHCYVVTVQADAPATCWLVPVTLAGAPADWSRRKAVPMPVPERLGPAVSAGPLVWSIRAAMDGGAA